MSVLDGGGNAVDAAIATAFAVAVVEPFASGLGGGGAAIVAPTGGRPQAYDYREVVARDGVIPRSGTGIPGFVAGMAALHEDHGEMEWAELLSPAITLASQGFEVSEFLALRLRSDSGPDAISGLPQFIGPDGLPLEAGDQLVQMDLAATMTALAEKGSQDFYTGEVAARLDAVDGIDAASLAAYEVVRAEPVRGPVGDYEIVSAAPALPGVALIQMLQVAEALGIAGVEPGSADYVEKLSTSWQVADAAVTEKLGDPAFVSVPVDELTDPARNAALATALDASAAPAPGDGGGGSGEAVTPGNTTHLTVVDSDGLMVSMTNTITNFWGGSNAQVVGGFFLNNQLSRFASLATPQNQPEPGRRSVSWAAPTVVLDDQGRPVLGMGSPGGRQIPNILANVLVRWGLHDQPLAAAVTATRFHLQEGELSTEEEPSEPVAARLQELGWAVDVVAGEEAVFGSVQALEVNHETGEITGAIDTRREATFKVDQP
ncbi:gamma-glutamyltransferase [Georgenia sp. AZ-5]|uniref:gamma-glutamyltransferase n=1 Tax=Georgenia sp. AZ-5 TaxID=3367526 RepID=UPI0037545E97